MAAVAAIATSVAVAGTVTGNDGSSLSADAKISPKKLSKTAPTPVALEVTTETTTSGPTGAINPVVKAVMDFDKNGTYFAKGLPTCNEKALLGKTSEQAEKICGKVHIGAGNVVATLFLGRPTDTTAELTAFNGVPKGGKPTIVLHAYSVDPFPAGYAFSGVVSNYKKEGYGSRFEIEFPSIFGGDGAIREFNLEIDKKLTYKGKERSVVSAESPTVRS